MKKDGTVYYVPAARKFEDTGYVSHGFSDGTVMTGRVVRSDDSAGFAIQLTIKGGNGKEYCNFTMDRFSALCLSDILIKNLTNQEELIYNEYNDANRAFNQRFDARNANNDSAGLGTRKGD